MCPKFEKDKTITFSIKEEEKDRERRAALRAVYDALSEKGYNPLNQLVGYILTEDPTYITNHRNARAIMSRMDRDELMAAILKKYLDL
ncbi:MAG: IreB family regulatory phosphoprotein [Clostridiales bacterium]|nr:IreB family regulatory phosphoprotein [Clostridiales bacterium]